MSSCYRAFQSVLLAAAALLVFGNSVSAQTTLQYRFKKDEILKFDIKQQMKMKIPIPDQGGQEMKMTMDFGTVLTWRVEAVDPAGGKATLKVTQEFKGMNMEMDDGMGNKEKKDLNDLFKEMEFDGKQLMDAAQAPYTATINAQGEITDVKLPEALEKTLKSLDKLGNDPAGVLGMLLGKFGSGLPNMAQQAINPTGLVFPNKPLAKGEKWQGKPFEIAMAGLMKVTQTKDFALDDPVKQEGKLLEKIRAEEAMKFNIDPKGFADKFDVKDIKFKGDGKSAGHLLFDNAAGRLRELEMKGGYDMVIELPCLPAIKMSISQIVTMKAVGDK